MHTGYEATGTASSFSDIAVTLTTLEPTSDTVKYVTSTTEAESWTTATNETIPPAKPGQLFPNYKNDIAKYGFPIILATGLVANTLSFIVIQASAIRTTSTGLYLSVLTWADCLCLVIWTLRFWVVPVLHLPYPWPLKSCNIRQFFISLGPSLSAMCIVAVTIDRFIVVCIPFKAKQLTKPKWAAVAILLVAVALISLFVPALFAFSPSCSIQPNLALYGRTVMFLLVNITQSYGPIICIICLNSAIVGTLIRSQKRLKDNVSRQNETKSKVLATVLAVSCIFVVSTLPFNLLVTLKSTNNIHLSPEALEIVFTVLALLFVSNHSINFFIYILTSASFRETFVSIFRLCGTCIKSSDRNQSQNQSTSLSSVSK